MEQFNYTYLAPSDAERKEIESIKSQYQPPKTEEGKLQRLRRLNAYVNNSATCIALVLGIIGALIFGTGLALVLEWGLIIVGALVAIAGTPAIALAYPVYKWVLKRNKEKHGPEILRLSEELLNEGEK